MSNQERSKTDSDRGFAALRQGIAEEEGERNALFETLFQCTPDPVFICDLDGILVDCNTCLSEMLECERVDLIGTPFFSEALFAERDLPEASQIMAKNRNGASAGPDEFELHTRNRVPVHVRITTHPVKMREDTFALGIVRDITEQKTAEAERDHIETRFRQAQKMEAIGTLAGGIAHEFNNILSPIMVYTELTLLDLPEDSDSSLRRSMEEVLAASDRARDLIGQILALSRQGEEEPYPLKITPIIKEVTKLLRVALPTTIKIRQHLTSETDTVLADPSQVHQVLMNLCTNAGDAMRKEGGVLEVSLQNVVLGPDARSAFPDIAPGGFIRLTVSDTGHGMEQAVLDRIFDPHFTTKEKGQRTGLGLAVVQAIISNYGGGIAVDSEPGKGTRFDVFFPEAGPETEKAAETVSQIRKGDESILLVDDDISLLTSTQWALGKLGYSVTAHISSIEALEVFRSDPTQFDLVITDQTMPNLTGENLSKALMEIRPDIPIMLCTGHSESIDEDRARALGIRQYLMKPIALRRMAATIRDILDPA